MTSFFPSHYNFNQKLHQIYYSNNRLNINNNNGDNNNSDKIIQCTTVQDSAVPDRARVGSGRIC